MKVSLKNQWDGRQEAAGWKKRPENTASIEENTKGGRERYKHLEMNLTN